MDRVWTRSTRRLPFPVADDWDGFMSADYGTALSVIETWAKIWLLRITNCNCEICEICEIREAFSRFWSAKEAFVKARGDGLAYPLGQAVDRDD